MRLPGGPPHALGNGIKREIPDIFYVRPEAFAPSRMREMAGEIGVMNAELFQEGRKHLLAGCGRLGSADRWLGIPGQWADICGVGAIVETPSGRAKSLPLTRVALFYNITGLGIDHIMIKEHTSDFLDWDWLQSQTISGETPHIGHVQLPVPLYLESDARNSLCVILDLSNREG